MYRYGGREWGRLTSLLPALAAELLLEGGIRQRGLLAPEALDPRPFLREVLATGIRCQVSREESTELGNFL